MVKFQRNTLIQWQADEKEPNVERVLWVDNALSQLVTIDIKDKLAWPVYRNYTEIKDAVEANQAEVLLSYEPFAIFSLPDESFRPEYSRRRDEAWELISELLKATPHQLFNKRERGRLIAELAKRTGRRKSTISVFLRHYWQRGATKNALRPAWHLCGQVKDRQDHGRKRGRPTKEKDVDGNSTGRNVTAQDQEIFRNGIEDFFNTGKVTNLQDTWQLIKERDYSNGSHELVDGEIAPTLLSAGETPTFDQFEYFYRKRRNIDEEIIGRLGNSEYALNHRPVLGRSEEIAFGPGSLYQIDATVGDIYLVSYLNRNHLIGRPVIYIVIDTFSRLIVGFAVTLEGPSWEGARLALENAFINKVSFCQQYGVTITNSQWPVEGVCAAIIGDNGEIKGYNANSLVIAFDVRVSNAPPRRADWKAVVERNFRTLNDIFIKWEPGYVHHRRNIKHKDYRFDAILDLNQFRTLMLKCIRFYNNCYRLKRYMKDEFMIPRNIAPVPIKLWNYGIEYLNGKLRWESPDNIRLNLLPEAEASITSRGIKFRGLHYTCDLAIQQQWFTRYKGRKTQHVRIGYEPRLVDNIYLRLKRDKTPIKCHLTSADTIYKGRDWYELLEEFALQKKAEKEAETEFHQSKADFHAEMEQINNEASRLTLMADDGEKLSRAERARGIRENRKNLKAHERKLANKEETNTDNVEPATVIPINQADKAPMPKGYIPPARPHSELRRQRERAKKNEK